MLSAWMDASYIPARPVSRNSDVASQDQGVDRSVRTAVIAGPAALIGEAESAVESDRGGVVDGDSQEKPPRAGRGYGVARRAQQMPARTGPPPIGQRADGQDFRLV